MKIRTTFEPLLILGQLCGAGSVVEVGTEHGRELIDSCLADEAPYLEPLHVNAPSPRRDPTVPPEELQMMLPPPPRVRRKRRSRRANRRQKIVRWVIDWLRRWE